MGIKLMDRYRAESMCECVWSFKETVLKETSSMKIVHEKQYDYWESRIELTDPAPENAGLYKCVVNNKYGEINANLSLNIEVAPVVRERPMVKKVEKKKSVVLQCAVQGTQDIDVKWYKEGHQITSISWVPCTAHWSTTDFFFSTFLTIGLSLTTGATSMFRDRFALISPYLLLTTHL